MEKQQDPAATPTEQDQPQAPEQTTQAPPAQAAAPGEAAAAEPDAEQLGQLLEDARSKADQHWEQVMRLRADLDNLNKRHARELENAHKFALERFVSELLGVWDSLELGHNAALEENVSVEKLREGTELTLKLLRDVMAKFGVEQLDPEGEPFNPDYHQAMSLQPRGDLPPNTVTAVIQKGYTLNGRLVRPAMVMVSQASSGGVDEQA
jgi:molecular chaperone GrpE